MRSWLFVLDIPGRKGVVYYTTRPVRSWHAAFDELEEFLGCHVHAVHIQSAQCLG